MFRLDETLLLDVYEGRELTFFKDCLLGVVLWRCFSVILHNLVSFRSPPDHQSDSNVSQNELQGSTLGIQNTPMDSLERFRCQHFG